MTKYNANQSVVIHAHYRPTHGYTKVIGVHGLADDRCTTYCTCNHTSMTCESTLCELYQTLSNFDCITSTVLVVPNI